MYIREYDRFMSDRPKQMMGGGIHSYHEVLYVSYGEFKIHWIGNAYIVRAPALFLFTPSSPHHIEQISPLLDCWFVEMRLQDRELEAMPGMETIITWNMSQDRIQWERDEFAELNGTVQAIGRAVVGNLPRTRGELFYRMLACDIQKLLLQIEHCVSVSLAAAKPAAECPVQPKWSAHGYIYDLIRHMEDHYMQDITLDELAKRSGYTPSYIIRLFKEMTGMTPFQYLYELRMYAATSYLQSSKMSVQDIAESIGFPNIHYFSRMFKKKFGESPTEWKRTNALK